ncbi:ClpP/crotonase [Basidiobolus meristosporus CBS 931.73]|uniref:ClpP/crotonase n=1 Tax=Basidiobolus meristosporus CBS 931.73 TaxID=1314790 RepID=A0A1Y1XE60_9FUNG|nr:ClpP/crotonase [Basidiobolus meristosporus CBS 931.73]|eukprot:ORX84061.1 ClpP/crotonase [Basidiobolus meristosporus CBS 931.73]
MPSQYVTADIKSDGYAVITIKREPVNSMNMDVWVQLLSALDELENNPKVRGVIFQSGISRPIFTAGNDLLELYAPKTSKERYTKFWKISNQFLARLYRSKLITISAIKGACPAGGCCLSMCCDYRVMSEDGYIGLNEVALGISVPNIWIKLMSSIIGQGKADKILQFAVLLDTKQAKEIGLIDEIVKEHDQVLPTAEGIMKQLLKTPDAGRQVTKGFLRNEFADVWGNEERLTKEAEGGFELLSLPRTVKALDGVFARLRKPKM